MREERSPACELIINHSPLIDAGRSRCAGGRCCRRCESSAVSESAMLAAAAAAGEGEEGGEGETTAGETAAVRSHRGVPSPTPQPPCCLSTASPLTVRRSASGTTSRSRMSCLHGTCH